MKNINTISDFLIYYKAPHGAFSYYDLQTFFNAIKN